MKRLIIHSKEINLPLIEPYWNVNKTVGEGNVDFSLPLIEPYWNVNLLYPSFSPSL